MAWTTTDLLTGIRRSGFLPDAHDLSSSDLLSLADEELATILAELWKTAREEIRVKVADLPITTGQRRYRIPRRALARTVRAVHYVDSQGFERQADEVPASEAWRYTVPPAWVSNARYYFEGDEMLLLASPTATEGFLRVRYYDRPPRLIETSAAVSITRANSSTALLVDTTPPTPVATSGALLDIVRGDSPFDTLYPDRISAGFAAGVLSLNGSTPLDPAEIADRTGGAVHGTRVDYVCPRDTTVYPPIPQELHAVLIKATIRSALEAIGDALGSERAGQTLARRENAARDLIQPRNADRKPAIIARSGALRGRNGGRSWWGR